MIAIDNIYTQSTHHVIRDNSPSKQAANDFTAMFIKKIISTNETDSSLITGEKREPAELYVNSLLNKELADIIAQKSHLSKQIHQLIKEDE